MKDYGLWGEIGPLVLYLSELGDVNTTRNYVIVHATEMRGSNER